jgi:probable F420-dependent oxidoreductase
MKLGVALPHFGPAASTDAIVKIARKAEALGFASLWVLDRLLWPIQPTSKYPGNPRGDMPRPMQSTWDPLIVLGFAAAQTERLLLGTSVLVASYRNPAVAAKMLATLDLLSRGRVIVGLGGGWNQDEFAAVGQCLDERNERTDEFIEVVKKLWQTDESSFSGKYFHVPPCIFLPKPLQRPHPPIWIGGNSGRALRRVAAYGDGWHPTSRIPVSELTDKMKHICEMARALGRKSEQIALSLRWNGFPDLTERKNVTIVRDKLHEYNEIGVKHICIDLNIPQPVPVSFMIESMERLMEDVVPSL